MNYPFKIKSPLVESSSSASVRVSKLLGRDGELKARDPRLPFLGAADLADGGVVLLAVALGAVPRELHGETEVDDDTGAVRLHQDVAAVQVPVGDGGLVEVWGRGGERRERREGGETLRCYSSFAFF